MSDVVTPVKKSRRVSDCQVARCFDQLVEEANRDRLKEEAQKVHDTIIVDGVRDMNSLVHHQEKIQGKIDRVVVFAETPSGGYKYRRWLWRVPIVVTANFTTKNLDLLDTDDDLGHPENRYVVRRQRQP